MVAAVAAVVLVALGILTVHKLLSGLSGWQALFPGLRFFEVFLQKQEPRKTLKQVQRKSELIMILQLLFLTKE